jgi:aminomethyltransferase
MRRMVGKLHHPALEDLHRELGAKLGAFGGWLMPIEYEGTLSEHRAVRERVGLFDLSHLGKLDAVGSGAVDGLQQLFTNELASLEVGRARYALLLNDDGGIADDLLVYRLGPDRYFVVPNASNTDLVAGLLRDEIGDGVEPHLDWCFLGVQGPRSVEVVGTLFAEAGALPYLGVAESSYAGERVVLARTGYTGELGFELFAPNAVAERLWEELSEAGDPFLIEPCGLGARDVLRLEMGYPLYGQDLSPERTPLEAGLGWAVAWQKGDFRGRAALLRRREAGFAERLRGLVLEERRHIPRAHQSVLATDGSTVGEVTSGTYSPALGRGIALAYVDAGCEPGDRVEVDIRGRRGPARVTTPPFVDRSPRAVRPSRTTGPPR